MKINNKYLLILISVVLVFTAFFSRLNKIETVPPHLSNDEISIAYDAYSLNKISKDEHGNKLPLSFQSHGTYKAPGYAYILSPLYNYFSNTNTTARIPSIIFGFLTIYIFYLITKELTNNTYISIISSLLLANSPWHIITSRMVLESNIALFFLSFAIYIFLKSTQKNNKYLVLFSTILFSLSMYCYHTQWLLSPLILLILLIIYYKNNFKILINTSILFIIINMPLFLDFLKNLGTTARANTEIIWKGESVINQINQHNNIFITPFIVIKSIFQKYLEYIDIGYLFFYGSELLGKKHLFEQGLLLWPTLISLIIGLIYLKKYIVKKHLKFFIIFLLLSPIVSSLTHGSASLVRNLNFIIPLSVIIAIGTYQIYFKYNNPLIKIIFTILLFISLVYFIQIYLFHYPKEKAEGFQGYYPIAKFLERNSKDYKHIYIDTKFGKKCQFIGVPHLYISYYQALDPNYLNNRIIDNLGTNFDKYTITQIDWNNFNFKDGDLYVVSVCNPPVSKILDKIKLTTTFIDSSGNPAFELWQTNTN